MLPGLELNSAKALAMSAHSFIGELAQSLVAPGEPTSDLIGCLAYAMPGIFERAILTSPHLWSDQALSVCEKFFPAFAEITRITSNAAGFSNPVKKLLFNVAFGRMFEREAAELRSTIRKIWDKSREDHADPLEYLSHALVGLAESKTGLRVASNQRISSVRQVLAEKFAAVH